MTNDYLMRYIEDTTRALAKFMLGRKDYGEHEIINEEGGFSHEGFLRYRLKKLVLEGKANEAENLLFETLEQDPAPVYLPVALDFYEQLSGLDDAALTSQNFSREEIAEGLAALRRLYEKADSLGYSRES